MNEHSIGKTIATLRKSKGWTQTELAKKLDVTDKAVSKWESEAGIPEISQFPSLANLFDVSIDYLMTGKMPEKEILTISKAELCAKTDDVSMALAVCDLPNDENNKNIVDYIVQYKSLKVFKRLCEDDERFIRRFDLLDAITLAILSNSTSFLNGQIFPVQRDYKFTFKNENTLKDLLPLEEKANFQNPMDKLSCLLPRSFFTMIVTDKRINQDTMNFILSPQKDQDYVWYHAFPYLIEEAYKNGNHELLKRLLNITKENNEIGYEEQENKKTYSSFYYFFAYQEYTHRRYGFVRILKSTIQLALKKGEFDFVDEFNGINAKLNTFISEKFHIDYSSKCHVADEDEIRVTKLKLDKSVSPMEFAIQSSVHKGMINIRELLEIHNIKAIKNALSMYPIHPVEMFCNLYYKKDWKTLFKLAIDHDLHDLADSLTVGYPNDIAREILTIWKNFKSLWQLKALCIEGNNSYINRFLDQYCGQRLPQSTLEEIIDAFHQIKDEILDELSNEYNKEKTVSELTKDFFDSELKKGNREIVIVKLCVRLEAILKTNYSYKGDFSEMLDQYCTARFSDDDEDNNYDPYTPKLLQKLRKERNGIVHSEKFSSPMTEDEIEECIDHICSL